MGYLYIMSSLVCVLRVFFREFCKIMDICIEKISDVFVEKVIDFSIKDFRGISNFDENLKTLERNIKQLSDKAADVKIEVKNQERFGKKRKREIDSWFNDVMNVCALKEEVTRGEIDPGALEKMNGRARELLEQSKHFGTLVHDMYEREECLLLVPEVHEEISKQNVEDIWTWLQDNNVSSIGIHGEKGVGKTTLAKHIHNRLLEKTHYQVCWVAL
ncbi:probable disease resistance protein At5g63020 [Lycium ferocissimum]|uniref:probable disease resistance protein At5g63020 n=1 Tax=Lycium ferocissimum TaxID=112874 RepID=UPI0028158EDC|nr:probable disease resistance protein At5g63020 [Lycium ferocissimum]XP_059276648.1 probable disease resistance protein At5g63020 [Lycium ferocissimum]XP_059276649.1 probable disease resistance protein At5g63020 [Lycium ferocissimum]XP_059276651.1 probable disease resistance protein At5g63020 [Lycium ferocissimum]XP_059276652.1 probable disease resistance protein At5g63020 [Lycium ferocissimum]XP_059276653.1 probable disease resistance protein At5g63020 [Lycium ferocissimum]